MPRKTIWVDIQNWFMRPGYAYNTDEGDIRDSSRNVLPKHYEGDLPYVSVLTRHSNKPVMVPNALIIAIEEHHPEGEDPWPMSTCRFCAEKQSFRVEQMGRIPAPLYVSWQRNEEAELRHELGCLGEMMKLDSCNESTGVLTMHVQQGAQFAERPHTYN